jgi:putative chitinase
MFTEQTLRSLWPHGDSVIPGLIAVIAAAAPTAFPKWGFVTDVSVAQAMAEFSEESGCGTEMKENMNYSAARLLQVFPTHFTPAQAIAMQHQPRLIADQAYNGRMGNRPGTDDGWDCRGEGLSQLTGRDALVGVSKLIEGVDLVNHPEYICDPAYALDIALADQVMCGCLPYALKDDMLGVASMLNVGHYVSDPHKINGFGLRAQQLAVWKHALGVA